MTRKTYKKFDRTWKPFFIDTEWKEYYYTNTHWWDFLVEVPTQMTSKEKIDYLEEQLEKSEESKNNLYERFFELQSDNEWLEFNNKMLRVFIVLLIFIALILLSFFFIN